MGARHIHGLLESTAPSTLAATGAFELAAGEVGSLAFRTTQHGSKENVRI